MRIRDTRNYFEESDDYEIAYDKWLRTLYQCSDCGEYFSMEDDLDLNGRCIDCKESFEWEQDHRFNLNKEK